MAPCTSCSSSTTPSRYCSSEWGIAQRQTLDCPSSQFLLTVVSILVLFCEHLLEMFDAVSCPQGRRYSGKQTSTDRHVGASVFGTGDFGSHARRALGIFSNGSQTATPYEEQVRLIREFLQLHLRNTRVLLMSGRRDTDRRSETQQLSRAVIDIITRRGWYCNALPDCLPCLYSAWSRAQSPALDFRKILTLLIKVYQIPLSL